jgi:hypothetical protein
MPTRYKNEEIRLIAPILSRTIKTTAIDEKAYFSISFGIDDRSTCQYSSAFEKKTGAIAMVIGPPTGGHAALSMREELWARRGRRAGVA